MLRTPADAKFSSKSFYTATVPFNGSSVKWLAWKKMLVDFKEFDAAYSSNYDSYQKSISVFELVVIQL